MSKYEKAILRYELARQSVNKLEEKRRFLVSSCSNNNDSFSPTNCFALAYLAYETILEEYADGNIYGHVTYEVFFQDYEFIGGVSACDSCREAFVIKHEALAEAKKEFGVAKRSLTAIGKQLIKRGEE